MDNSVNLVIGSEAIKQVQSLTSDLILARKEVLGLADDSLRLSKSLASINTPSGLDKTVQSTASLNSELTKQNAIISQLQQQIQKLTIAKQQATTQYNSLGNSINSVNKSTRESSVANQIARAETDRNFRATTLLAGAYARASAQLLILKKQAKDAAIAYGENSKQAITASKAALDLDTRIKTADKSVGDYQRNVGNYTGGVVGGFKSIFSGVRQLAYILPGLGIAGIFNIAIEAITTLVEKMDLFKSKANQVKQANDTLNKSFEESSVKDATKNVEELTINIGLAKAGFLDKQKVVDQYNETIGKTTGLVGSLDEAEKELTKNGDAYIKMTLYKAAANLALEDAAKQSLAAEKSRLKELKEFAEQSADVGVSVGSTAPGYDPTAAARVARKNIEAQKKNKAEEIKISTDAAKQSIDIAKKFQEDAAKIAKDFDFNLFGDTKKETVKKTKQDKAKREDLAYLESYIKPVSTIVDEINKEINRLTTEKIIANQEELPAINEQLRLLLELKKQLNEVPTGGALPNAIVVPNPKPELDKLKSDWKETFNEIADSAQKAGEIIAGFSEMNFKNEYARLEAQKDISLKFAGDSAEAKAKIEADYEKKHKEIANRENKAKQRQALFNIAIDTAQAVMATVGKTGFAGLPLALILGAFGLAQATLVASQKIPEYFAGTDNHIGGLMLVNDGGGSNYQEKVILPNGKEVMPEGRNVLMNAPAGTKVLTHEQQIREMLNERGISMSRNYASSGMTAQEMDSVMAKHFSKIQVNNTTFDRSGFSSWAESNGNRTKQNANRVSRTGFKV